MSTLRDLAVEYDINDNGLITVIENLTKYSGLLQSMPVAPSSHGIFHRYSLAADLATGGFRALNGSIVPSSVSKDIETEDLFEMTALDELDSSYVENMPKDVMGVFADRSPQFSVGMGQKLASQFFYGINGSGDVDGFAGLRDLAIANGLNQSMGGDEGSSSTMFIVRWQPGVMEGLFNSNMVNAGEIVRTELIGKGATYTKVTNTSTGATTFKKGAKHTSYLGLLKAGISNVAVITNIEDASGNSTTAAAIDKGIEQVKGYTNSGEVAIYCNSRVYRLTNTLKNGKLETVAADNLYSARLATWDGIIPLWIDDNITNTEDYS